MTPIDDSLATLLADRLGAPVTPSADDAGTLVLDVPHERWREAAVLLRDVVGLSFFDWLSAVDAPDAAQPGLSVVLHVADPNRRGGRGLRRVLLRTHVPDAVGRLDSLTAVWPGAAWHERETFEMFGLRFPGFDDGSDRGLRPLLLPDGFEGTPLRKAFVLAARAAKPWPGAKEPGESDAGGSPSRRKTLPPGVPDPATWARPPADVEPAADGDAADGGAADGGGADGGGASARGER